MRVRDLQTATARTSIAEAFADIDLAGLGWARAARRAPADLLQAHPGSCPARVLRVERGRMLLTACGGAPPVYVRDRSDEPHPTVVGDWVLVDAPELHASGHGSARSRIPRGPVIARRRDRESASPQVIASNVDLLIIVEARAPDRDPNVGRIARMLALALAGGAEACVAFTHADLVDEPEPHLDEVRTISTSTVDGRGLDDLLALLIPGSTAALIGPSGSGKSSLVNALYGSYVQAVSSTRASGTGRHTTAASQLIALPNGGLIADTPGIRAVGMHAGVDAESLTPQAVSALAAECRFRDCTHGGEPACAVTAAIERGDLEPDAVIRWRKLEREALREQARADAGLRRQLNAEMLATHKAHERARRRGEVPNRRR